MLTFHILNVLLIRLNRTNSSLPLTLAFLPVIVVANDVRCATTAVNAHMNIDYCGMRSEVSGPKLAVLQGCELALNGV